MADRRPVVRVQTGVRLEKRILLVLGDLLEGIVLHAFEGKAPFGAATLTRIRALREIYGLDLVATDSHRLTETPAKPPRDPAPGPRKRRPSR
jgi:hypothetical protein